MSDEPHGPGEDAIRIPVAEERLRVDKQVVETGRVKAVSTVSTEERVIENDLSRTAIRVERIPVDRLVNVPPPTRTEADRTVVSVIEEVMVKRIRVIEEVHLISEQCSEAVETPVTLRRVDVDVQRTGSAERGDTNP